MLGEINRLRKMSVAELREEWLRLYGSPATSSNRDFLFKRLAWRLQELAHGGLSDRAKQRLKELGQDVFAEARTANLHADVAVAAPVEKPPRPVRDLRMPSAGTVLTRQYHGREIRVTVLADGFEWDSRRYGSLSEVARAVTGARWNGRLFFHLTERRRRS